MKRLPGALLLFLLASSSRAEDCKDCTPAKLCDAHAASDKDALKALREGLAKPAPEDRVAAIADFVTAVGVHPNCRPAANAQALAAGFGDPDGSVRKAAAEAEGSQDPKVAAALLTPQVEPTVKKLEKDPKGPKEEAEWLSGYDFLRGICAALVKVGAPSAGPAIAKLMESHRLKVLDLACETFPSIHAKEVPPAVIEAIDRVRYSKPGADRDRTWVNLLKAWEEMTQAHIKSPDASAPSDAIRYVVECKAWWKANEKTWK